MANQTSKTYRLQAGFGEAEILQMRQDVSRQLREADVAGNSAYMLVNVLDEFCCNTMEHGQARWVEIAVDWGLESMQVCIRDDGQEFDPVKAIKEIDPELPAKVSNRSLGLYMVGLMTRDLDYHRLDGVNELKFEVKK